MSTASERTLILHHYPASPFAEKVRLMFGFKALRWRSVNIPVVMPKPEVLALTGGYRRTPILQIGADIFCDTALIARVLDRLSTNSPLLPENVPGSAAMVSAWGDSTWFSACVALATQPEGLKTLFEGASAADLAAFAEDRKAFRAGGTAPRLPVPAANAVVLNTLKRMERQFALGGQPYLLGAQATLADFSVYHPLWFLERARAVAVVLEAYPSVRAWMQRIASLGHGQSEPMSSAEAISLANEQGKSYAALAASGRRVRVSATDYGIDPSEGMLVHEDDDSWVIARSDPRAGSVRVHFPRVGYAMTSVDQDSALSR